MALDVLCVLVYIIANYILLKLNEQTIWEFRESFLQAKDFSVQVQGLPSKQIYKNESLLKSMLWDHIVEVISEQP